MPLLAHDALTWLCIFTWRHVSHSRPAYPPPTCAVSDRANPAGTRWHGRRVSAGAAGRLHTAKASGWPPPQVLDKEMVERAKLAPQIKKEIAIMRRLRHPNVVDLRHVMATRSHIYLVLELVTGASHSSHSTHIAALFHDICSGTTAMTL
jgi:serine/threonine protein kinase